jgi:hypothetical protein
LARTQPASAIQNGNNTGSATANSGSPIAHASGSDPAQRRGSGVHRRRSLQLARLAKPPLELHLMDGANHFMFVDADPRVTFNLHNWLDRFFLAGQSIVGKAGASA